ncbi:TPA: hypothetical protein SAY52_001408 [Burkholderia cenocepacia]|uniref:hypothetical protein n=1 Tax=Burkholderia sp. BCC0801 TaxID=2676291 RepID=UPI00158F5112|nr:hypothetical protein [Burkholderia sp. BCC0801]HEF5870830.1 hypothetical protein [Burkholderia cenocepacia]
MATITLRGTKWQVKIRRKGQPSLSATFVSEEAAKRWAEEHEHGDTIKSVETGPTVGDLFRKYIAHPMPDKRSSEWDRRTLQRLLKRERKLCSIPAAELNKSHLTEWRDRRITEVLGSSVGRELDAISAAYRTAIDEWNMGITVNPVRGFRRPKLPLPRDVRLMAGAVPCTDVYIPFCRLPFLCSAGTTEQGLRPATARRARGRVAPVQMHGGSDATPSHRPPD